MYAQSNVWLVCYANSLDAWVPEVWAQESLAILEEQMVIGNLVHRDFSDEIAKFGDTVNTRKPAEYTAKRKSTQDNVVVQDSSATNVDVRLNQHVHVSYLIRDGEESKSLTSLVDEYMAPAALAMARHIDKVLLYQVYQYLANVEGSLLKLTDSNVVDKILDVRNRMNVNKAHVDGRRYIWAPRSETSALKNAVFHEADKVGDGGTALREAALGRKMGFDHWMAQNVPSIIAGNTVAAALVDNVGGYPAGTSVVHIDTAGSSAAAGQWVVFDGDDIPHRITATANLATEDVDLTIDPPLKRPVLDDAAATIYIHGLVDNTPSGYPAGYDKEIAVDGLVANILQVGQMVSFGADKYGLMEVKVVGGDTVGVTLDRPLEQAVADNAVMGVGPAGDYNLAFHRNALAMVVRPLAMPRTGALSGVASFNDLSMRVVATYDGDKQGHLVTHDLLMGVKVLDPALAAVGLG